MNKKRYFDVMNWAQEPNDPTTWIINIGRTGDNSTKSYYRYPGSPSARRCTRLLANIAESEVQR